MALVETADRPGLVTLANLSDENFAMLRAALNSVSPAENDITGPLTQILALPENQVRDIVSSLMALSAYNLPEADLSRFVSDISQEMVLGDANPRIAPKESAVFGQRLIALLMSEPVRVRSKGRALLFETPQVFQTARIMTDLRPVFGGDAELRVSGAIVKHDLKIEFADREGFKQFFVTMDDADIRSLKLALERAERKARLLRSLLQRFQVPDFNPSEPEK